MPIIPINCNNLGELDRGMAGAIIDAAFKDAIRDMEDRGEDGKPRKVEIHVAFERMDNGDIVTTVEAIAKVPRRRTAGTVGTVRGRKDGAQELLFSVHSPEEPDQKTIDDYIDH